jgi:hypothetical protein
MGVGIMRYSTIKRRDLNVSYTLGCAGRNNSKTSIGSSGPLGNETWSDVKETKGPELHSS